HDVLQRDVVGDEADSWVQMAADPNQRAVVVAGILGGTEANTIALQNLYNDLLRRNLDSMGLNSFVPQLTAGLDIRVVAAQILLSSEYFTSAGQVLWVERVYQDALGRGASQAEVAGWVSLLHAGTSRTQVAVGIANSPEANAYLINKLYQSLLGRSADAAA